jgi:uncharacterized protein YceK
MSINFKLKIVALLLPILCFCGGCSTLVRHGFLDPVLGLGTTGIYRGTQLDANCIFRPKYENEPVPPDPGVVVPHKDEILTVCYGITDFPFSLTADTFLFPYDLTTIHQGNPN